MSNRGCSAALVLQNQAGRTPLRASCITTAVAALLLAQATPPPAPSAPQPPNPSAVPERIAPPQGAPVIGSDATPPNRAPPTGAAGDTQGQTGIAPENRESLGSAGQTPAQPR